MPLDGSYSTFYQIRSTACDPLPSSRPYFSMFPNRQYVDGICRDKQHALAPTAEACLCRWTWGSCRLLRPARCTRSGFGPLVWGRSAMQQLTQRPLSLPLFPQLHAPMQVESLPLSQNASGWRHDLVAISIGLPQVPRPLLSHGDSLIASSRY